MSDSLLTAEEVAARLGMGTDWVYAQVRAGRIPHVKLGRYVRFRPESVDRWLSEIEYGSGFTTTKRQPAASALPAPRRTHQEAFNARQI